MVYKPLRINRFISLIRNIKIHMCNDFYTNIEQRKIIWGKYKNNGKIPTSILGTH